MTYAYPLVTATDQNGAWTRTTVDGLGRTIKTEQGHGGTTVSVVDTEYAACGCSPSGKMKRISQPYAPGGAVLWTTYTYDWLGRTLSVGLPGGAGTTSYVYEGATVKVTDPAGKWKRFSYDVFGNIRKVEEPRPGGGSYETSYVYDVLDRLTGVTMGRDGTTQSRTWTYDAGTQRLATVTMPESGTTSYTYNADGTLQRKTDAKGQKVEYGYDGLKRVTSINRFAAGQGQPDPCQGVLVSYDVMYVSSNDSANQNPYGRVTKYETGKPNCQGGEIAERYDYLKSGATSYKSMTVTTNGGSHRMEWSRVFDPQGRVVTEYYPEAHRIDYGYDAMSRVNVMNWADRILTFPGWSTPRSLVSNVSFNAAGQVAAMTYLGYTETRGYNALQQLTRMTATSGGVVKMDMEYRFSATANDGRVTQSKDWVSGEEVTYQYDTLNRLIAASTTGPEWGQGYTYDGFGNMSAQSVTKGTAPVFSLTVNAANNQVANWSYDANGNVVNDGSKTYSYDVENRLTATSSAGTGYVYDAMNRRVYTQGARTGFYTFWSPDGRRIYEYTLQASGGLLAIRKKAQVYYGGKLVAVESVGAGSGCVVCFVGVVTDRLGSVRVNGTQSMRYYPYGQEITSTANGQDKFGTYLRDEETGLDYADQRYYSPGTGRFLTADPYIASGGPSDPQSWNRYAYVAGDPVNRVRV
jgi:RHS repeat-associated protein